jgi:hypothetical protein
MLQLAMSNAGLNLNPTSEPKPNASTIQVPGEASVTVRLAKSNAVVNLGVRLPEGAAGGIIAGDRADITVLVTLSSDFYFLSCPLLETKKFIALLQPGM